jgi:hypothetical protein
MSIHPRTLLLLAAAAVASPALAQSFPAAPGDNVTFSIGKAIIWVEPAFAPLVSSTPGWGQDGPGHWTSPFLYDGNTTIGHSKAHNSGDATDLGGAIVGTAGSIVADSNFTIHPNNGPAGAREVHTEMYKLRLEEPAGCNSGIRIRGGTGEGVSFPSFGEVEANGAADFPAESFFQVYVEIDTPFGTLRNIDPLLVYNPAINSMPPSVVYIHGLTPAVNVFFMGGPNNGQRFGILRLAGHQAAPGGQERCPDPCGYCPVRDDLDQALADSQMMRCRSSRDCYAYDVTDDGQIIKPDVIQPNPRP